MNLAKFLKYVDNAVSEMTGEQIAAFIHEIARTLPEKQRNHFIETLKAVRTSKNTAENKTDPDIDALDLLHRSIEDVTEYLDAIMEGDLRLDSEIDYRYDHSHGWDDDDFDFLFSDPEDILPKIDEAIELLHRCIDLEAYKEGAELAKNLSQLTVDVEGEYEDYVGNPLQISDLFEEDLLDGTYDNYVHEALYLIYTGNSLKERPVLLYDFILRLQYFNTKLEDIMQLGDQDLPDFDEFLPLWIAYLGEQNGRVAGILLDEALSMAGDDQYLEASRKFYITHPKLYKNILQNGITGKDDAKMIGIGLEALKKIQEMSDLRGEIALLTADHANKVSDKETAEQCWLEAFQSYTSLENYLRLRFLSKDYEMISEQVKRIYEDDRRESKNNAYFSGKDKKTCAILFFEKRFDEVIKTGLSYPDALGWTYSFMKEGLALFFLLFFHESYVPGGIREMRANVLQWMNFDLKKFLSGTAVAGGNDLDEIFWQLFEVWRSDIDIPAEDYDNWMKHIEKQLSKRLAGIMEASRTKYYEECAAFIAAYGEVLESNGVPHAKERIMEEYRNKYPRRRNFIQALRSYGMYG